MKMMKRTILKILMFAVFCLPFSLVNSLSLLLPFSSLSRDPTLLTLLHLLCAAQFSLNFLVYTDSALVSRAWLCLSSLLERDSPLTSITLPGTWNGESSS